MGHLPCARNYTKEGRQEARSLGWASKGVERWGGREQKKSKLRLGEVKLPNSKLFLSHSFFFFLLFIFYCLFI